MKSFFALFSSTLAVFGALFVATTAQARTYNCSADVNGSRLIAVVDIGDASSSTQLTLDGDTIAPVGACFEMQRPSTRFLRCAHEGENLRIELYPWVETTSGAFKSMEVVIWRGVKADRGSFDCN